MQKTSQKLKQRNCRKQIADVLDFPAQTSELQEGKQGCRESNQDFSLKLSDFLKKQKKRIDLNGCSLKMLEICYQSQKDLILQGYSLHWIKLGMTHNGKCWIVPALKCHSTEKGYTLSDILEEEVEEKYFQNHPGLSDRRLYRPPQGPGRRQ